MKANLGIAGVVAAAAVLVAPIGERDAHAAGHANGFGEKGEVIITADRLVPLFSYTYASTTQTTNNGVELTTSSSGSGISMLFGQNLAGTNGTRVPYNVHTVPRIAFDVTIIRSLTLGAGLAVAFGFGGTNKSDNQAGGVRTTRSSDAPSSTAIGVTPRVGYIFPIAESFAFWPRVGLGIYSVSSSNEVELAGTTTSTKTSDTLFSLDLDPQFAIIPLEHFFIHVGPVLNVPLTGSRSETRTVTTGATVTTSKSSDNASLLNFGISAGLGGWFNVF